MKIVFCLHHFLPDFVAGTEIYTLRLAQYVQQFGNEVVVIIPNFNQPNTIEYQFEGVRVIKYSEKSTSNRNLIMGKIAPDGLVNFTKVLESERPDIIHFHELGGGTGINLFHVKKVKELNIAIVTTFHLAGYTCLQGSLVYKDVTKCDGMINIKKCTECTYHSKGILGTKAAILGTAAIGLYKIKMDTTIFNNSIGTALGFPFVIDKIKTDLLKLSALSNKIVVLTMWYKDILQQNGIPDSKLLYLQQGLTSEAVPLLINTVIKLPLKIVFIGRISKLKGLHLLISAICSLPDDTVELYIYGGETEPGYLAECKKAAGLNKNIFWMGMLASEIVIPTLSKYHVLCLPSTFSEMSPLVIQEAFAAGLPVIASDVYGNAEQIKNGVNGWLFRFKDSGDLAKKIQMIVDDIGLINKAKMNLPATHKFKDIALEHVKLYRAILANVELTN